MARIDTKWVHSGGKNNKNPDRDLGGEDSQFEIAEQSLNNLFGDISPEEGVTGLTDYRCFYIVNPWPTLHLKDLLLTRTENALGSDINIGVKEADDVQRLLLLGADGSSLSPDSDGYIIVDTEFGPAFQVDYGNDPSFATMAANFEDKLRLLPFCSTCTANAVVPATGAPYIEVTFAGEAGRRNTRMIHIIANRLTSTQAGNFILLPAVTGDPYNRTSDSQIAAINLPSYTPIDLDSFDATGIIHVLDPSTGLWSHLSYTGISTTGDLANTIFDLAIPLDFDAAIKGSGNPTFPPIFDVYGEAYVEPRDDKRFLVKVVKVTEGSPINTTTAIIPTDTTEPSDITWGTSITTLGNLFSQEKMPIWIRRTTAAGVAAIANDYFDLSITGTLFS